MKKIFQLKVWKYFKKNHKNQFIFSSKTIEELSKKEFKKEIKQPNFIDKFYRHRSFIEFPEYGQVPRKSLDSFIAPCATIAGNVYIGNKVSIWYGCVIRGDINGIYIGSYSNIQDNTVIHESLYPISEEHNGSTKIGSFVTIGHSCLLRGCTIENECLVGMHSTLEEGSYMEEQSILGANSVLTKNSRIHHGELWLGNPAKFIRHLTDDEIEDLTRGALHYKHLAEKHKEEFFLDNDLYKQLEKLFPDEPLGYSTKLKIER